MSTRNIQRLEEKQRSAINEIEAFHRLDDETLAALPYDQWIQPIKAVMEIEQLLLLEYEAQEMRLEAANLARRMRKRGSKTTAIRYGIHKVLHCMDN